MMTTEDTKQTQTVTYNENILNFLDYTILLLSQTNSADDIDIIMDDFLSDDFIDLLVENKELFSILSVIWVDAFKRVFVDNKETSFSLKVLWIPILIDKLGWSIEDKTILNQIHLTCLDNAKKDDSLYDQLSLLFVEGILSTPDKAFNTFKTNALDLATSSQDIEDINRLLENIASLGWPNTPDKPVGSASLSEQEMDSVSCH